MLIIGQWEALFRALRLPSPKDYDIKGIPVPLPFEVADFITRARVEAASSSSLSSLVGRIDEDAATWIRLWAPVSRKILGMSGPMPDELKRAFSWAKAPQGKPFWAQIAGKIKTLEALEVDLFELCKDLIGAGVPKFEIKAEIRKTGKRYIRELTIEEAEATYDQLSMMRNEIKRSSMHSPVRELVPSEAQVAAKREASVIRGEVQVSELWWQKRDREARTQLDRTIALRRETRAIIGDYTAIHPGLEAQEGESHA